MIGDARSLLGKLLRRSADRIDPERAPRAVGWSFTFEPYRGIVWNHERRGCPVWYLSKADYQRAHDEASIR